MKEINLIEIPEDFNIYEINASFEMMEKMGFIAEVFMWNTPEGRIPVLKTIGFDKEGRKITIGRD